MRYMSRLPLCAALLAALAAAPLPAQEARPETLREAGRAGEQAAREAGASRAEVARAREELRIAERELQRASERVAVLAQQSAAADIERAFERPAFGRPGLGIVMARAEGGVRLAAVTPGSPAARAGLRGGDLLVAINGTALEGSAEQAMQQASELIGRPGEGEVVRVTYRRGDAAPREMALEAEVLPGLAWVVEHQLSRAAGTAAHGSFVPDVDFEISSIAPFSGCAGTGCDYGWLSQALRWRGLRLAEVDARLGRYFGVDRGVLVLKAEGDGLQALEPGDVILEVGGDAVDEPAEAMRRLGAAGGGDAVELDVQRDRQRRTLSLTVPELAQWQLIAPPPPPPPPAPPAPRPPGAPRAPAPPAPEGAPAPPPPPDPAHAAAPPPPQQPPAPPAAPQPPDPGVLERILR